jgi:hypothetical protein
MEKSKASKIILIIAIFIVAAGVVLNGHYHFLGGSTPAKTTKELYYCPMHPNFTSDKPRECAICGMSLVKRETAGPTGAKPSEGAAKKILFYRNPMDPTVTSHVPMKDSMGMDYIPVYEEQASKTAQSGVYINPAKQQLIGVKKQKVEVKSLSGQILTVGTVAYDPDLFVAQQEYLQTIKSRNLSGDSNFGYSTHQAEEFIKTAKRKLLLMGMSSTEIERLEASGKAEQSLYLPEGNKVWVYVTIYEYEAGFVKEGLPVEVEALAYPGQTFTGEIVSVAPMLEPMTRSLKVRTLVDNPENKLKLQMYVNVRLTYNLGEKLAVPEDAVMHTGTRNIVFVVDADGYFAPKTAKLGAKAQGYYEVLGGLKAGEEVVTSGNFLIDSESKLNAVLSQMADIKDTNQ